MPRIAFLVENNLGHRTHLAYLQRYVPMEGIDAVWVPIEPYAPDLWSRLPLFASQPPLSWSGRAWSRLRQLRQRRPAIDLFYLHTVNIALAARFACGTTPHVISLDGTPEPAESFAAYRQGPAASGIKGRLREHLYGAALRSATAVIGMSPWVTESLRRHYGVPPDRANTQCHGVDTALWGRVAPARGGRPRILFVGGDFERKGGPALVRVWRERLRSLADLDIVSKSAPAGLASESGIRVHGELGAESPELLRVFAEASVFALPTQADTIPWVVLEAMAAGLPVVCTRVGGVPAMVADGHTGHLVDVADEHGLGAALEALVRDPALAASMGERGRQRVQANFEAETNYRALARNLAGLTDMR